MHRLQVVVGAMAAATLAAGTAFAVSQPTASHRRSAARLTTTTVAPVSTPTSAPVSTTTTTTPKAATVSLVRYGNCSQVLAGIKAEALSEVGPYGLNSPGYVREFAPTAGGGVAAVGSSGAAAGGNSGAAAGGNSGAAGASAGSAGATAAAPASASGTAAPEGYSTTNDQEAGADEPDIAKTNGQLLVTIRHEPVGMEVATVGSGGPHLDSFLALPQAGYSPELFLSGGYAVVVSQGPPASSGASTSVVVVNLQNPDHPAVARTFQLQGSETGARLIAGRVIVVLQSEPALPFASPDFSSPSSGTAQAQQAATAQNRAVIENSTLSQWLPSVTVSPGGRTWPTDCASTLHPDVASGLGTVSVVSLDPASDQPGPEVTVVGNASTVYASVDSLYVATSSWTDQVEQGGPVEQVSPVGPGSSVTTDIHGFDLSNPSAPHYVGSGTVPGTLIGQYAMSEYGGDLRVATTVGFASPAPGEGSAPQQLSDNRVTVLAPKAGALVPIGAVGGLGQGEKIYGVRFVGALGYVVTFRQTDPLYVVNLSDPTDPVVAGQLSLTGFSSFLQPLKGSWLLGVGQSVDANLRQTGLQLSVFDTSTPANPALLSRVEMAGAYSSAENDPHALLWWPTRNLVAMPVNGGSFGLVVWRVGPTGQLHQVASLSQPATSPPPGGCSGTSCPPTPAPGGASSAPAASGSEACAGCMMVAPYYGNGIERALVVGNFLYTVSDGGIMATDMTNWTQAAWLAFNGS